LIAHFSNLKDLSSALVYQYLLYLGYESKTKYFRTEDFCNELFIQIDNESDFVFNFNTLSNSAFSLCEIKTSFERRFQFLNINEFRNYENERISEFADSETKLISNLLTNCLNDFPDKYGNSIEERRGDKLIQLKVAKDVDMCIPPTIITTSKVKLRSFLENYGSIIVKPISNHTGFYDGDDDFVWQSTGTQVFSMRDLDELPEYFFPTLFQKKIDKSYEIRAFYFNKRIWPMAIFSQKNPKTQLDFRNYDNERPNRYVPYKFEREMEQKIISFCQKLKYTTGSLDFVYEEEKDQYSFLEINPSGLINMTSRPCNYNIEKFIAEYLIQANEKTNNI